MWQYAETMVWKDVMRHLFDKAKAQEGAFTHEDFALRHGIPRETVTRMLSGAYVPHAKTMWKILEREGYALNDCIELPEMRAERKEYVQILEGLLERQDAAAIFLKEFLEWRQREANPSHAQTPRKSKSRGPPEMFLKKQRVS